MIARLEAVLATAADALDAGAVVIVEESRQRAPAPDRAALPASEPPAGEEVAAGRR